MFNASRWRRFLQQWKVIRRDALRKPWLKMAADILSLWRHNRRFPRHYFSRFLYRRDTGDPSAYFAPHAFYAVIQALGCNSRKYRGVLFNKLFMQYHFERHGLSVPRMLGFTAGGHFLHDGGILPLRSEDDLKEILAFGLRSSTTGGVFLKSALGMGGHGAFRFQADGGAQQPADAVARLFLAVQGDTYLMQETLQQHAALNTLCPSCINTIRLDTFIHDDGRVEVCSGILRLGTGGAAVDNGSSGGIFIGMDLASGRLRKHAYRLLEHGGERFTKHPDTHVVFAGYAIPHLAEARSLVERAAALTPDLRFTGWDVAVEPEGVVLIEGNPTYHFGMQDIAYGGYLQHPTIRMMVDRWGR